jgi:hypothetical protein
MYICTGFQAFTDPDNKDAAILNCAIVFSTALGVFLVVQGDNQKDWAEEKVQLSVHVFFVFFMFFFNHA